MHSLCHRHILYIFYSILFVSLVYIGFYSITIHAHMNHMKWNIYFRLWDVFHVLRVHRTCFLLNTYKMTSSISLGKNDNPWFAVSRSSIKEILYLIFYKWHSTCVRQTPCQNYRIWSCKVHLHIIWLLFFEFTSKCNYFSSIFLSLSPLYSTTVLH